MEKKYSSENLKKLSTKEIQQLAIELAKKRHFSQHTIDLINSVEQDKSVREDLEIFLMNPDLPEYVVKDLIVIS